MMAVIWLLVGLALVLWGANALTDGSSSIASRLGVSDLVVGLTVVAFGTSTPELVISIVSAVNGSAPLAVGNTIGSNIFNILAIIGITALVRPIKVERTIMTTELPILLLSSVVIWALGNSSWINGFGNNIISRTDGIFLLLAFALFMRHTLAAARTQQQAPTEGQNNRGMPVWRSILYIVLGLTALIFGGDRFVAGASSIAIKAGISEGVVGLTIVAIGTSLPELATSVVAAIKGKPGLAVGNVIGSNIFNIFMVLGITSTISPLPFEGIDNMDLGTLLVASILFYLFAWVYKKRTITRLEGMVLLLCYIAYMTALLLRL
jgi:cation:H+ antiporter